MKNLIRWWYVETSSPEKLQIFWTGFWFLAFVVATGAYAFYG